MNEADNLFEYNGCDTTTLARRENPQTSKDAAVKLVNSGELNRQEQVVYGAIESYTSHATHNSKYKDFTTKDIAHWITDYSYGKSYDICRKRFSGLQMKGKIEPIQRTVDIGGKTYKVAITKSSKPAYKRRDGCRVWRLK